MELPKNIVQIGKPDKVHKIYIEDYVVSYIKQLNRTCEDRNVGLALYGNFFEEEGCKYYFLYGAAKIEGLQHRGAYLSQAEKEEIANVGNRYFSEYEFLAWCSLKGEPVEKLFVLLQGKGVEVEGYACFYERNESMLNYMLLSGQSTEENRRARSEVSGYGDGAENRPARGEWIASNYMRSSSKEPLVQMPIGKPEETKGPVNKKEAAKSVVAKRTDYMRMAAVGLFLVLCVIGISTLNDYGKLEDLQVVANRVIANMTEQKLPDTEGENVISSGDARGNTISGNALEDITATKQPATNTPNPDTSALPSASPVPTMQAVASTSGLPTAQPVTPTPAPTTEVLSQAVEAVHPTSETGDFSEMEKEADDEAVSAVQEYSSYTIAKGDTLISICTIRYGSLDRLQEICELNGISDADNIQVGQIILLP